MSTPRTLWVTNDFPPRLGGIETFVSELVSRLDPAGVRVLAAAAPGDAEHDADLPFPVERIGRRPLLPTPAVTRRGWCGWVSVRSCGGWRAVSTASG
jgi:phosphatidyl-myo-inositol dimannoside synthase